MSTSRVSGLKTIKAFKRMGFIKTRQKGSHVTLVKQTGFGKIVCVVPLHKEIRPKTFSRILQQAKVSKAEFFKHYK